jgi:hypothetical protein
MLFPVERTQKEKRELIVFRDRLSVDCCISMIVRPHEDLSTADVSLVSFCK